MTGQSLCHRIEELERKASALEPDPAHRRRLRAAAIASSERFLETLDTRRAFEESHEPGPGLQALPIADRGVPIDAALELLEQQVIRPGAQPASGGHLAYLSGGGIYHAALADYLAAISNKYAGLFFTGPGPAKMESMVLRWVADLVGYPPAASGWIASGGSLANLAAVVAARDAHRVEGADLASAVVYLSGQTHHSLRKALRIAGLGEVRVRSIELDERYRMRPAALASAIADDRRRGRRPWLIVATAGSTDTGAVDPLDALADIAERERCWLHVDAAYGGFFLLTENGRRRLAGIERSHSAVLDPHKGLFLPWGTGIVVVRDRRWLMSANAAGGAYLQDTRAAEELSPADVSPELTKPFRALRMWLPLVVLGTAPFRAALEEKLLLARYFRRRARDLGFAVGPSPDLSIVTFRWAPPGVSPERADRLNEALLAAVREDGRIFLSSTRLDGRFTLRMAALVHRTHLRSIDLAVEILAEQVAALAA